MNYYSTFEKLKSPLSYKLLLTILISSTIITFFILTVQLFFEYKTDIKLIENRINQIEKSYTDSLALSVWNFNKNQYNIQLDGILNLEDIVYTEIINPDGNKIISKGINPKSKKITKEFILKTVDFNKSVISGKLIIVASLQRVYNDLLNRIFIILFTQGIKTLLISFIILYAFHILVTRHLYKISHYAREIDLSSNNKLILDRTLNDKKDELDYIVFALNDMQDKINNSYKKIQEQKVLYDLVFEKSSNGVLMLDANTGKFIQCNNRIVKMLKAKSKDEILDMHPSQLSPEFQPDGRRSDEKSNEMIKKAIENGTNIFEWKHIRSDGEEFWAEVILTKLIVDNSMIIYATWKDIDDEKKTHDQVLEKSYLLAKANTQLQESRYKLEQLNNSLEEKVKQRTVELKESSENFKYLFDNTIEAMGIFQDNICVDINEAGVKLFNFKIKSNAIGMKTIDFIAPDSIELVKEKLITSYKYPYEANALKADGTIFPVLIKGHNKILGGKSSRITSLFDISELKKKEIELQQANNELSYLTNIDPLTGAYNRRYFHNVTKELIALSKREDRPLSLAMIDIDDFKKVNDTYGHDIGDKVIKTLVNIVSNNIRESDFLIRFGGEEFITLLPNTHVEQAFIVLEKIRKKIEQCDLIEDVSFTVSVGISKFINDENNIEKTIKRADENLYLAKNSGKNKIEIDLSNKDV